jgi:hypothetical protein
MLYLLVLRLAACGLACIGQGTFAVLRHSILSGRCPPSLYYRALCSSIASGVEGFCFTVYLR